MRNSEQQANTIDEKILLYVKSNTLDFSGISAERKADLDKIADSPVFRNNSYTISIYFTEIRHAIPYTNFTLHFAIRSQTEKMPFIGDGI